MTEISDYYLIGDLQTAALVSNRGSIDWLCLPDFNSDSVFAYILDKKAGRFGIEDKGYQVTSSYIKETAIVEYEFKKKDCAFIMKDFMLPRPVVDCTNHFLVRKLKGIKGQTEVRFTFEPKPHYGKNPKIRKLKDGDIVTEIGKDKMKLNLPKSSKSVKTKHGFLITISLKENEIKNLVLEYAENSAKYKEDGKDKESKTKRYWRNWVKKGDYFDFDRDTIIRSAITLKMMQFYPTGALIAAPTTSLPDDPGGYRNWDYRYVWIRDATFTMYAFYVLDFTEEAKKFFEFMHKILDGCTESNKKLNTLYDIWGNKCTKEKELKHLSGYENSKPVRLGNNAAVQFQLDTYGALLDAHYFVMKKMDKVLNKKYIMYLVDKIEELWKEKDAGIWEFRMDPEHHTYSKVMCWVGIDRTLRIKDKIELSDEEVERCEKLRKEIKDWIWENCYDKEKKNMMMYAGGDEIDSANYLFVLIEFLDKYDKITPGILKNTSRELVENDVFVYRFLMDDNLPGRDRAFVLCTFWRISAWAILEQTDKAERLYNKFKEYINETGLMSEQIDAETGRYLGNFPQAFSHLGMIMSAHYIDKYKKRG